MSVDEQLREYRNRMAKRDSEEVVPSSAKSEKSWPIELIDIPPSEMSLLDGNGNGKSGDILQMQGLESVQDSEIIVSPLEDDVDFVNDIDQLIYTHNQQQSDEELARRLERELNEPIPENLPPAHVPINLRPTTRDLQDLMTAQQQLEQEAIQRGVDFDQLVYERMQRGESILPQHREPTRTTDPFSALFSAFFGSSSWPSGGANNQELDRIPCYSIERHEAGVNCPICLADFEQGETALVLPACLHRFHESCGIEWLKIRKQCPVCREDVDLRAT